MLSLAFKDGLDRALFNDCFTILLPTAAATRLPLLVSRFKPLGGGVGGGVVELSFLGYGMGCINFEVEAEVPTTVRWTNLLLSNSLFSSCISCSFLVEADVRNFFTAPPDLTLSRAV